MDLHDIGVPGASVPDGFTVVAVGDLIVEHPILPMLEHHAPELLALLRGADLVLGNFEGTALDLRRFDGWAEAQSGFGWLLASPDTAADLRAIGFDMMARANNHALDWGVAGMLATDALLRDAGIAIAGTGASMTEARSAAHAFSRARGAATEGAARRMRPRCALLSFTSTFEPNVPAADASGRLGPRPGASTLRAKPVVVLDPERFDALKAIRDSLPPGTMPPPLVAAEPEGTLFFFERVFRRGAPGQDTALAWRVVEDDLEGIVHHVRQAKQTCDFVALAAHVHEPSNWVETPPGFLVDTARAAIAHGADLVFGHGPHQLRGIELIDGRPVFHSLGNFALMENVRETVPRDEWERPEWALLPGGAEIDPRRRTPAEFMEWMRAGVLFPDPLWYESVVAEVRYRGDGRVERIRLIPIELSFEPIDGSRHSRRGLPRLAHGEQARCIVDRLARLSAPFGTVVRLRDGAGPRPWGEIVPGAAGEP